MYAWRLAVCREWLHGCLKISMDESHTVGVCRTLFPIFHISKTSLRQAILA